MAKDWKPDYPLTIEQVSLIASRYLPVSGRPEIAYLGDGCDFDAYRVNEFVLRFPKREEYVQYYFSEVKLLDRLSESGHPWIPKYIGIWEDRSLYPYPFGAYPFLPGITGHSQPLIMTESDIGRFSIFLQILHTIDEEKLAEWGIPKVDYEWSAIEQNELIEEDLAWLITNNPSHDVEILNKLRDSVKIPEVFGKKVLTHTDLLPEHIIVNPQENRIVGVIDWADSMLGDPVADFVGLYLWQGRSITERVLEGYGKNLGANFWERVRFNAYRCIVGELRYGYERQRQIYIEGAMRWLRNFEADSY